MSLSLRIIKIKSNGENKSQNYQKLSKFPYSSTLEKNCKILKKIIDGKSNVRIHLGYIRKR